MLDEVLENFDFGEVVATMEKLNWKWASISGSKVPNVDQLKKTAKDLLLDAMLSAEEDSSIKPNVAYHVSTGGLEATAVLGESYRTEYLELKFVLTSYSASTDDE